MTRVQEYPDRTTHRKRSVLPTTLQKDIVKLSRAVYGGRDIQSPLSHYVSGISSLPTSSISRAAWEIRDIGGLYQGRRMRAGFWPFSRKEDKSINAELEVLTQNPELSHLFMFHGDGRLREAALRELRAPLESPFQFAALVYRLNDWVEQVRDAARECAKRVFPATSAEIAAEASLYLFTQIQQLKRWEEDERQVIETTLYRDDVLRALADLLVRRNTGSLGSVLRQALAQPGLDAVLPRLVRDAAQPMVRAISLETLIARKARWQDGYEWQWLDKPYGIGRMVCKFDQRRVEHQLCIETLLSEGSRDHAVVVRRAVARGLIDLRHELSPEMKDIGRRFLQDRSLAVREKAEFYLNNLPAS